MTTQVASASTGFQAATPVPSHDPLNPLEKEFTDRLAAAITDRAAAGAALPKEPAAIEERVQGAARDLAAEHRGGNFSDPQLAALRRSAVSNGTLPRDFKAASLIAGAKLLAKQNPDSARQVGARAIGQDMVEVIAAPRLNDLDKARIAQLLVNSEYGRSLGADSLVDELGMVESGPLSGRQKAALEQAINRSDLAQSLGPSAGKFLQRYSSDQARAASANRDFNAVATAMFDKFMVHAVGTAQVEPPEAVRTLAGRDAKVTALPIIFNPVDGKGGIRQGVLWRVDAPDGQTQFVDPMGQSYKELADFVSNNKFPDGTIRIPRSGQLTLRPDGSVDFENLKMDLEQKVTDRLADAIETGAAAGTALPKDPAAIEARVLRAAQRIAAEFQGKLKFSDPQLAALPRSSVSDATFRRALTAASLIAGAKLQAKQFPDVGRQVGMRAISQDMVAVMAAPQLNGPDKPRIAQLLVNSAYGRSLGAGLLPGEMATVESSPLSGEQKSVLERTISQSDLAQSLGPNAHQFLQHYSSDQARAALANRALGARFAKRSPHASAEDRARARDQHFNAVATAMFDKFMIHSVDAAQLQVLPPEVVGINAGKNAKVTALPIIFNPAEGKGGIQQGVLWRVDAPNGQTRFVDPMGRTYDDIRAFVDHNKFPDGTIRIPRDGQLTLRPDGNVDFEDIKKAQSTFDKVWYWGGIAVDGVAILGMGAMTVAAIVGTGGLATPVAAAAWTAIGLSTVNHVSSGVMDLADRAQHGQSWGPNQETAGDYLGIGSAAAMPVGMFAPRLFAALASNGILGIDSAVIGAKSVAGGTAAVNFGAAAHSTWGLVTDWDELPIPDRVLGVMNTAVMATGTVANGAHAVNVRKLMDQAKAETTVRFLTDAARGSDITREQQNRAAELLAQTRPGQDLIAAAQARMDAHDPAAIPQGDRTAILTAVEELHEGRPALTKQDEMHLSRFVDAVGPAAHDLDATISADVAALPPRARSQFIERLRSASADEHGQISAFLALLPPHYGPEDRARMVEFLMWLPPHARTGPGSAMVWLSRFGFSEKVVDLNMGADPLKPEEVTEIHKRMLDVASAAIVEGVPDRFWNFNTAAPELSAIDKVATLMHARGVEAMLPHNSIRAASRTLVALVKKHIAEGRELRILALSGFAVDKDQPETDGPVGAAFLGRDYQRLGDALGLPVTLMYAADATNKPVQEAVNRSIGMDVDVDDLASGEQAAVPDPRRHKVKVHLFESSHEEAEAGRKANALLDETKPDLVISVEVVGSKGLNMRGVDVRPFNAPLHAVSRAAGERSGMNVLSIFDGGNEDHAGGVNVYMPRDPNMPRYLLTRGGADLRAFMETNPGGLGMDSTVGSLLQHLRASEDPYASTMLKTIGHLREYLNRVSGVDPGERSTVGGLLVAVNAASGPKVDIFTTEPVKNNPVVASVSNWGAQALIGEVLHQFGRLDLMHEPSEVEQAIMAAGAAGAVDGVTRRPPSNTELSGVDGLSVPAHVGWTRMARAALAAPSKIVRTPAKVLKVIFFDSSHGGIVGSDTIAREIRNAGGTVSRVLLLDHGNAPYGDPTLHTQEEVGELTHRALVTAEKLGLTIDADTVVMVCNTACTVGRRRYLGKGKPDEIRLVKALDLIDVSTQNMVDRMGHHGDTHPIIIATETTIASMAYPNKVRELSGGRLTIRPGIAAPKWAPDVNALKHLSDDPSVKEEVRRDVREVIDAIPADELTSIWWCCTHYPALKELAREELDGRAAALEARAGAPDTQPSDRSALRQQAFNLRRAEIVDPMVFQARALVEHMGLKPLEPGSRVPSPEATAPPVIVTTGDARQVYSDASRLLGRRDVRVVQIPAFGPDADVSAIAQRFTWPGSQSWRQALNASLRLYELQHRYSDTELRGRYDTLLRKVNPLGPPPEPPPGPSDPDAGGSPVRRRSIRHAIGAAASAAWGSRPLRVHAVMAGVTLPLSAVVDPGILALGNAAGFMLRGTLTGVSTASPKFRPRLMSALQTVGFVMNGSSHDYSTEHGLGQPYNAGYAGTDQALGGRQLFNATAPRQPSNAAGQSYPLTKWELYGGLGLATLANSSFMVQYSIPAGPTAWIPTIGFMGSTGYLLAKTAWNDLRPSIARWRGQPTVAPSRSSGEPVDVRVAKYSIAVGTVGIGAQLWNAAWSKRNEQKNGPEPKPAAPAIPNQSNVPTPKVPIFPVAPKPNRARGGTRRAHRSAAQQPAAPTIVVPLPKKRPSGANRPRSSKPAGRSSPAGPIARRARAAPLARSSTPSRAAVVQRPKRVVRPPNGVRTRKSKPPTPSLPEARRLRRHRISRKMPQTW